MSWFSERFKIAEVDGITFYTQDALNQYLHDKKVEEKRKGLHNYKVHCGCSRIQKNTALNILNQQNIFDVEVYKDNGDYIVSYWASSCKVFVKDR